MVCSITTTCYIPSITSRINNVNIHYKFSTRLPLSSTASGTMVNIVIGSGTMETTTMGPDPMVDISMVSDLIIYIYIFIIYSNILIIRLYLQEE